MGGTTQHPSTHSRDELFRGRCMVQLAIFHNTNTIAYSIVWRDNIGKVYRWRIYVTVVYVCEYYENAYMSVCIYVCVYICLCVCLYVYIHVCVYFYLHMCVHFPALPRVYTRRGDSRTGEALV
eukprot:GHVQ01041260.1.p2 GENE.GHVQ01041260.1~~GHVQ01041260.1.p2  ORF type:complete len:123 (-),score=5.30 GHVQ01041260.1:63-431(-)